jgi:membrane fusion protein (multidrug efflux system)
VAEENVQQNTGQGGSQIGAQPVEPAPNRVSHPEPTTDETQTETPRPQSRKRYLVIGGVLLLILFALLYWLHSRHFEDTDDAQVDGHLNQISARVAGHIVQVNVEENKMVQQGQILAVIDPRDYLVALQEAEAAVAAAQANYEATNVNVPVTGISTVSTTSSAAADVQAASGAIDQSKKQFDAAEDRVVSAAAAAKKAQLDVERYTPLVERDVISKQQYDAAVSTADQTTAQVHEAQANVVAAAAAVRVANDRLKQSEARLRDAQTGPQQVAIQRSKADQAAGQLKEAQAQVAQAKLNLSYTNVIAPYAGIVNKKSIELGENVAVGQNMMTIISLDDVWVTANFKETQLHYMQPGQSVRIHVDAYDRDYQGRVTQIGGATGSKLSLFPPENATGNYVKVVQRVPVRVDFSDKNENNDHLLRPGLSVTPKVTVR